MSALAVAPASETIRQRLDREFSALQQERTTWEPHWKELAEQIFPWRYRFQSAGQATTEHNRGDKRNQKIINSTARLAARTLRSGLMAGLTSPAREWKRLTTPDPDLAEWGPVRAWLHLVNQRMSTVFLRSNVYNALPVAYGDEGVFGTSAMAVLEDSETAIRTYTFPVGSYWLATNDRGLVDTFYRQVPMTVRQVVDAFGDKEAGPDRRWAPFSTEVRTAYERGDYQTLVTVIHAVRPNEEFDGRYLEARFKRYASRYWESGRNESREIFLRESGFDEFPVLATRWDVTGEDVYGTSPGMDALGDTKALQLLEKRKSQAIEKGINPPMTGPTALRNQKATILPGDVTYVDVREGQQGFKPAHEVRYELQYALLDIEAHETRIRRAFYEDLFLMLAMSDRRQITAREIEERHEEKLLQLGPMLERQNDEKLDPLVDRTFAIMLRLGLIPKAPREIQGVDLKVEYLSIMAQAQKAVGTAAVERTVNFALAIAERTQDPSVLDKIDADQAIDEYADMAGVSPRIIRSDEAVAARRQQRAAAQQQAGRAEQLAAGAKGIAALSQASLEGDTALSRLVNVAGAAAGVRP